MIETTSPEQVTSIEFLNESVRLFTQETPLTQLEILVSPLTDDRHTLVEIREFFESPLFFDTDSRDNLKEVTGFLVKYPDIKNAMWVTKVKEQELIFHIETQVQNEVEVAILTYGLKEFRQQDLDNFIESEDVHKVTLQETKQSVYVESKVDLHAEFEVLAESKVKLSGYDIRVINDVLEAKFGGKWYSLESAVDKDSDIYQLLSKVTEAIKNGQTAFTVTTHGISPATSKKFELKEQSAEYIINIFDINLGRVYNYILVDKSLEDVKAILAKYGIELNIENPDLTFGAVNDFNKQQFEKDNFGVNLESNQVDLSSTDFDLQADKSETTKTYIYPFQLHKDDFSETTSTLEITEIATSTDLLPSPFDKINTPENKPKHPFLTDGLIIIETNKNVPSDIDRKIEAIEIDEHKNYQQVVVNQSKKMEWRETAWQVYDTEAWHIEFEETASEQPFLEIDQDLETVNIEQFAEKSIAVATSSTRQVELGFVTATSTPKVEVVQPIVTLEKATDLQLANQSFEHNQPIDQLAEKSIAVATLSTRQVDIAFTKSKSNLDSNIFVSEQYRTLGVGNGFVVELSTLQNSFKKIDVLETDWDYFSDESKNHSNYLYAKADETFTWPHTMTKAEAEAIRKTVEAKTGRTVIEIRTSSMGKLQVITI